MGNISSWTILYGGGLGLDIELRFGAKTYDPLSDDIVPTTNLYGVQGIPSGTANVGFAALDCYRVVNVWRVTIQFKLVNNTQSKLHPDGYLYISLAWR